MLVFSGTDHIDMKSLPGDNDPMGRGNSAVSAVASFSLMHAKKRRAPAPPQLDSIGFLLNLLRAFTSRWRPSGDYYLSRCQELAAHPIPQAPGAKGESARDYVEVC